MLAFPYDKLGELVTQATRWMKFAGEREALTLIFTKEPPAVVMFYNGSEKEGKDRCKPFYDLDPIMDQSGEIPYIELNSKYNNFSGFGKCRILKGSHFAKHKLEIIKKTLDRMVELTTEEHQPMMMLEHVPLKKILSVPNGTAAFHRKLALNMVLSVTWSNNTPENLAIARQIIRELNEIFVAGQVEELGLINHGYGNFDAFVGDVGNSLPGLKNTPEVLFGDNYPRLREIKKRYDPNNIFSKWFAITPALNLEK